MFIAGALGALCKDIFQDNSLVLPRFCEGSVLLGFLGGALVGGFVGMAVDGNFLEASLSGYVGNSAIYSLIPDRFKQKTE